MLSWRATFLLVGIWGIVIMYYIWRWVPHVEGLKAVSYTHLKKELILPFNPTEFDAEEWMRHASEAGMRYFVITAKHQDVYKRQILWTSRK